MKKTLLITLEYPPMIGGVANYYQNLVEQLPASHIRVLDNRDGALLSTSRFVWPHWLKAIVSVRRAMKEQGTEHILVGQILPLGTVALILSWFFGKPYTVMTHAMDITIPFGPHGSKSKQQLMRFILKYAHSVTTVSTYTKMQLESLFDVDPRKIRLVYPCPHYNGVQYSEKEIQSMADVIDDQYQLQGKKVILTVGRLVERKGVDYVITALQQITKKIPEAVYCIVGTGECQSTLESLVEKYGLQKNVMFVGAENDDMVRHWYARCDVFIMPSRELRTRDVEGFGIVFVEAGSFGKPVIGGKSGGILDAVLDGENGYVVSPMDLDMIAQAVVRLLTNPEEAQRFGQEGKQRVKQYFEWQIQAKKLEGLLD